MKSFRIQKGFIAAYAAMFVLALGFGVLLKYSNNSVSADFLRFYNINQNPPGTIYPNTCTKNDIQSTPQEATAAEKKVYGASAQAYNIVIQPGTAWARPMRLVIAPMQIQASGNGGTVQFKVAITNNWQNYSPNTERMIFHFQDKDARTLIYFKAANSFPPGKTWTGSFTKVFTNYSASWMNIQFAGKHNDGFLCHPLNIQNSINAGGGDGGDGGDGDGDGGDNNGQITVNPTSLSLEIGEVRLVTTNVTQAQSKMYTVALSPTNGIVQRKWDCPNENACKLKVTAVKNGSAKLTISNSNGVLTSIPITVGEGSGNGSQITVNPTSLSLKIDETKSITTNVTKAQSKIYQFALTPANGIIKKAWDCTTTNACILKVTGLKEGEAKLSISNSDGILVSIPIVVGAGNDDGDDDIEEGNFSVDLKAGYNSVVVPRVLASVLTQKLLAENTDNANPNFVIFDFNRDGNKIWRSTQKGDDIPTMVKWVGYYIYSKSARTISLPTGTATDEGNWYKGWNLMANSGTAAKKLSDITVDAYSTDKALSELFNDGKVHAKIYIISDGNTTDPAKAFTILDVTKDNVSTLEIPGRKAYWVYLFD